MAYSTRSYARGYLSGGRLPPGIKWLLIANTAVFLLEFSRVADFRLCSPHWSWFPPR